MTDRTLFCAAAAALLGDRWRRPLSRRLDVDERLVRRWETGARPLPEWLLPRMRELLEEAAGPMNEILAALSAEER